MELLMILQRYTFGSKSQHDTPSALPRYRCLWYCKDIHLEANHNHSLTASFISVVAYDIAKIYIWKQITTTTQVQQSIERLLMILQRYTFGSKSQHNGYHVQELNVAYDIAKIYIWKQITTLSRYLRKNRCCLWYCKDRQL